MRFPDSQKDVHRLTIALLALFAVASGWAILVQQHFCIDGASFFAQVLKLQSYNGGADFPRHHAHYVTQSLTVLLIKAGVRDVNLLSVSFGVGLYLPLIAGVKMHPSRR